MVELVSITGALPSLPKQAYFTLESGKLKGSTGCNDLFGKYAASNTSLQFTNLAATKIFCADAMEVEKNLLLAFNEANNFRIEGNLLELMKDNSLLAKFQGNLIPRIRRLFILS